MANSTSRLKSFAEKLSSFPTVYFEKKLVNRLGSSSGARVIRLDKFSFSKRNWGKYPEDVLLSDCD